MRAALRMMTVEKAKLSTENANLLVTSAAAHAAMDAAVEVEQELRKEVRLLPPHKLAHFLMAAI